MVLEKTFESPLDCKEIQPVHPKGNQSWIFIGRCWSWSTNTLATWYEELTHWKRPWCWQRLRAGREWDDRGWDGWIASPTWWIWVWASSGSWWWTGKPSVLQSMGPDMTEQLNGTDNQKVYRVLLYSEVWWLFQKFLGFFCQGIPFLLERVANKLCGYSDLGNWQTFFQKWTKWAHHFKQLRAFVVNDKTGYFKW